MNPGDRVIITCKPQRDEHHHPEIRAKRAAMNGKTGEVVTIATLSGDVLVEADGVRSWFWASELTPAPSVEAELRATIAGLRDELANEKAAHAECERLLSEARKRLETTTDKVLEQHDARIEAEKRRQRAAQVLTEEDARRWERLRVVASAIRDREYEGDFRVSDETAMLFDELRHAIAAVENTQTATPQRAPLTAEEARIARGLQACAAAWEPDIRLIGNLTAREIERFASAILSRGEVPPDVRSAPASSPLGEWQCASCHARETEAHRAWCEIEGKAGTIATRTHEPSSPTCGLPSEADRAALAIVVSGSPVRFAITTGTEVKKLDPDKRKLMAAFVDSAGLRPLLHELRHQAPRPFERTADGWRPIDPSKEAGELEPNRA